MKASDLENECRPYKNMPLKERLQIIHSVLNSGQRALEIRRKMNDPSLSRIAADPLPKSTVELIEKLVQRQNQKRYFSTLIQNNLDIALRIATNFEKANIPYAIGGALAYNMYGVPRSTIDVDLNVFVTTTSALFEKVLEGRPLIT